MTAFDFAEPGEFTVAFDVDGTLLDYDNTPREDVLSLLWAFKALGCIVYVWSGSGASYAAFHVERLGLDVDGVFAKKKGFDVDLVIDDQDATALGKLLFKVPPLIALASDRKGKDV